jgi:hypothetical protein
MSTLNISVTTGGVGRGSVTDQNLDGGFVGLLRHVSLLHRVREKGADALAGMHP